VTRGRLPQRAGSLGLNGGGAAAAVPQTFMLMAIRTGNGSGLFHRCQGRTQPFTRGVCDTNGRGLFAHC